MDAQLTTAPPNGSTPTEAPPRRRRWARWAALAIVLAMTGFAVYAGVFLSNYQPLFGWGGASQNPTGARDLGHYFAPSGEDFEAYQIALRTGDTFSYGFSLNNYGPVGVTITDVGYSGPSRDVLIVVGRQMDVGVHRTRLVPFTPFSLPPNGTREVVLTERFTSCVDPNSILSFGSVPVTFRVFGITRHTVVTLPYSIEVVTPPGTACSHTPNGERTIQSPEPNVSSSSS